MRQKRENRQLWWIGSLLILAAFLLFQPGTTAVHADGAISGTVFRDFNSNGVLDANEPGIGGITVTAVTDTGATAATTTNANGVYNIPTLTGSQARVEFTLPTDGSLDFLHPSVAGGTTVQFIDISGGDASNVNAGFLNPAQYSVPVPQVVVPRWTRGEPTVAPQNADATIRGHNYNADGQLGAITLTDYANYQQVGTIFGLAHQTQAGVIFGSTYIRRGAAVGPTNTTGAIYKLTGTGAPSLFIDLTTIVGTGSNPHPNGAGTDWIVDSATYPLVGKIGLGDLEISDDETTLYAVNLNDRELVIIPLTFDNNGQPLPPSAGDVSTVAIPLPPGCNGDGVTQPAASDWRPFALKYFDGTLYVGGVCSGESMITGLGLDPATSTFTNLAPIRPFLRAHVFEFNPGANVFNPTPILSMQLDYGRERVNDSMLDANNDGEWLPWTNFWRPNWAGQTGGGIVANPQPILADIEFDGHGFMFLGFRDRFADQAYDAGDPGPNNAALTNQRFGGDLWLACLDAGGNWQLESGDPRSCTNGLTGVTRTGGTSLDSGYSLPEFFHNEQYLVNGVPTNPLYHDETFLGTLAVLYGSGQLVGTKYDVFAAFEGGTITYDTANGDRLRAVQIYAPNTGFGKAGGLGDVELLGGAAPVEVGNRVWRDENGNGIQDPGEPPIPGVVVELHDADGLLLASTTTDANGLYYFTNVQTVGTVAAQISAGTDDAEQRTDTGAMDLGGGDLDIGNNNNASQPHAVGLRFTALNIPQGAIITSAQIQFTTDNTGPSNLGNPAVFTIDGQASDNATTFTATANNITDNTIRPRTTLGAQVTWSTPTWTGVGVAGPNQLTPDLSDIVQEIVDRPGWAAGNAMVFFINSSAQHREAETFNGVAANAPRLLVNYIVQPANYADLQYRAGYELRVDLNQAALNGMSVSPPQTDGSAFGELRDSDGQPRSGGYVAVNFTTGGPGENNHTFDFGFAPLTSLGDFVWDDQDNDGFYDGPVQVGDFVWYDRNGNGVQNAGEPGVNGVGVALHRSTDADCTTLPLATTTTGADGRYLFDNLPPGNYFVCFNLATIPGGFVVTVAGGDNAADSTGRTGNTGPLAAGQQDLTRDMGIVNTAGSVSVGDRVWYDLNANGRQDPNEPGVPGVTVHLFTLGQDCADTPVATLITDVNGLYRFTGLGNGNYFVCFDLTTIPPGYTLTAANNQLDDSVDSDADANGQTPPTGPLTAGQFDFTLDMGLVSGGNVTVGDRVWYDDNANGLQDVGEGGVPGIRVRLFADGQDCTTDTPLMVTTTGGDGSYLFTGLPSGNYFVCFDLTTLPPGFSVTTQNVGGDDTIDSDADPGTGATASTGLIPANGSDLTLDMGIRQIDGGTVSVGDRVWYDDNRNGVQDPGEMGVPGVTVNLHLATAVDCTGAVADTTTTDDQGNYIFDTLSPDDYFVCFDLTTIPAGYVVTPPDQGGDDGLDSDANRTTGQTPATGALAAGQSNMTLDMGIYAPTHEIRIPGVTVQLYAAATICDGTSYIAQVTTDANGNYLFTGLPGGQYYVHIPASNFAPGGPLEYKFATLFTDPNPDDNQNNDNSAAEVTAGACAGGLNTNLVTLAITTEPLNDGTTDRNTPDNSNNLTVDMAAYEPVCLGDQVWYDADDSGTLNGAEYGINGITLNLYLDVDDDGIFEPGGDDGAPIATTMTANVGGQDGSYSFCTLIPGNYFVHIPPTQFVAGALLNQTRSSTTVVDPVATVDEDDNNGTDGGDAATNGIVVATRITLERRVEPTFDRNINDNGRRDSNTNQTVDFGITLNAPMDFGDLPTSYNNTIFGDDGPRHPNTGLFLGAVWDADNDGQESLATNGDDINNLDDEDGVIINVDETWGDGEGIVEITVSGGSGCVLGWVDFSGDGNFNDEVDDGSGNPLVSEFLFARLMGTGTTPESFIAPRSSVGGGTYVYPGELNMRFRIFPTGDPLFAARGVTLDGNGCPAASNTTATMAFVSVGAASGGEVEDYQHQFSPTAVSLQNIQATMRSTPLLLLVLGAMALAALTGLGIALARRRV